MSDSLPDSVPSPTSEFDVTLAVDNLKEARTKGQLTHPGQPVPAKPRSKNQLEDNDGWIDGKFRLLEKLGEGGFGLVYKAEQIQPIHRLVAVKILKAGMDTQQVIARFATERQSLALMEHPNIARVLDAGETERGQPYFVMELVRGRSITSYAKKQELDIRQRIQLFIPVCQAVNHAHQKGIIHRDLKPSNVMVMEENGLPTPKVIDFGIAKVLEQKDVRQTLATGMDQLVGTPGYISPEQIEHGSSHVDTRSDVYALGSILLELLSGRPLVTAMDVAQKPLHQILRDQVELDPPRPSSREPLLKGDLDWIILKALEKEPSRRYGSAEELADDLRRYLEDQPVKACPPSRGYLIGKFVRRHRVGVAAGLSVSLAVLAGGITSTALYFEAEKNRVEAQQGRENVKKEFSRSDEQMARQLIERSEDTDAVSRLCRALRTDPDNTLAATNLLTLLEHRHLLHATTPDLPLPTGTLEARLVAVSPSAGRVLAVSSRQNPGHTAQDVLSLWDVQSHARTDHLLPAGVIATAVQISRDGRHAIVAQDDGRVMLWTLQDGRAIALEPRLPGSAKQEAQSVLCLTLSGDGFTLAAGGEHGTLLLWDMRHPQHPARTFPQIGLNGTPAPITQLTLDHLGTLVVSASNPALLGQTTTKGIVNVHDAVTGQLIGEPIQVDEGIGALAVHREREMLAIGLYSGVVHVLNFRALQELMPDLQHPSAVTSLALNADASTLTVGDAGGYLHAWDLTKHRPRFPAQKHDGPILVAQQAAELGLVASVSRHGELQIWNTLTQERLQHRLQHSLAQVHITRDCAMLAIAPRYQPMVQAWSIHQRMTTRRFLAPPEVSYGRPTELPETLPPQLVKAATSTWNQSGTLAAAADAEGRVQVLDLRTGRPLGPAFQHPPAVGAVALAEDGSLAVTSGRDQEIRLWEVRSGKSTGIIIRPGSFVSSLVLSRDHQRLVTLTDEGEIRVWETQFGACLTPAIHAGPGIDHLQLSETNRDLLFRVAKRGWFSLPMPPESPRLPHWFLDLAEALGRRRLSSDGKTQALQLTDLEKAKAAVPRQPAAEEEIAHRWARWLLSTPDQRCLSPQDDQPLSDYLSALKQQATPASLDELRRFQAETAP